MQINIIGSTNGLTKKEDILRFIQACALQCYSSQTFNELIEKPLDMERIHGFISMGHHSVFDNFTDTFSMEQIPKALAMILNNEQFYNTSEQSARYTKMKNVKEGQREKYDKWMKIFIPLIDGIYPSLNDIEQRNRKIKKLSQENARYMTSVFTLTNMVHMIPLRQINYLIHEFEDFVKEHGNGGDEYKARLANAMKEFLGQDSIKNLKIDGLRNQTGRHLTFFDDEAGVVYFNEEGYSTNYLMSFACLGQAQRHRTINYSVFDGWQLGAPHGFFIPKIIRDRSDLREEWNNDLSEIAKDDFPQAQLLYVNETATLYDFNSKTILRLCGHAQHEIMENTLNTGKKYESRISEIGEMLIPKCKRGYKCNEACAWGGDRALERLI